MKQDKENQLIMEEIAVKNLQEITGGTAVSDIFTKTAGIISRPVLTGLVRPTAGIIAPKLPIKTIDLR